MAGQRVRVSAPEHELRLAEAELLGLSGDTLRLLQRGITLRVPLSDLSRLDVQVRSGRRGVNALGGAALGTLLGAAAAYALLAAQYARNDYIIFGAVLHGVPLGAAFGGLLGFGAGEPRWRSVPLPVKPLASISPPE